MLYCFNIKDDNAELIFMRHSIDKLVYQENFPPSEIREGFKAVLKYNETDGVHWEYVEAESEATEEDYKTALNALGVNTDEEE